MRIHTVSTCVLAAGLLASVASADVTKVVDNNNGAGDVSSYFVEASFPLSSDNGQLGSTGGVQVVADSASSWNIGSFNRGNTPHIADGSFAGNISAGQISNGGDADISVVPLPAASLMAGMGLVGLGIRRRRA